MKVLSLDFVGTLITMDMLDYFWNTIIPRHYSEEKGIEFGEAKRFVLEEYDKVGVNDLRWYLPEYWLKRFGLSVSKEKLLKESLSRLKIYQDAERALPKLLRSYEVVIISNASKEFIEAFLSYKRLKVRETFSTVSDLGVTSKSPQVYRKIMRELKENRPLHVGDDFVQDFLNPRVAGWDSLLLNREASNRREKDVIVSLEELL